MLQSRNRARHRCLRVPLAMLSVAALAGSAVDAASAAGDADRKVSVVVAQECVAPSYQISNGCSIRGVLPGRAVDGSDLTWEVTVFSNDLWRLQFQAFSEGPSGECQYPIRVWGSDGAPGLDPVSFVVRSGTDLGVATQQYPSLTLTVDRIRIDTLPTACA